MSAKRIQLWLLGLISVVAWITLSQASRSYGDAGLLHLLIVSFTCFAASVAVWHIYRRESTIPLLDILGFALLFRLVGLFTFPVLEDDFYRYLWDGFVAFEYGNPYLASPSEWFDRDVPPAMANLLDSINYPEIGTVYGPTLQWLFAFCYWLAPGELWPLKVLLLLADVALVWALLKLAPSKHLVLYVWSPLIIKEFVISVHPDLFGATLMLLAILAYQRQHDGLLGLLMALALGVKVFAIIVLPFLFLLRWKAWASFLLTAIVIAIPFGLKQAWLPEGLSVMGQLWLFNAGLYELFSAVINLETLRLILLGGFFVLAAFYGLHWLLRHWQADAPRTIMRADWLFGGLLIVLPALNPWYLIWLLPFAAIWPSTWAWTASFAVLISYACGINLSAPLGAGLQDYQHPGWVLLIEFGLIALAICWDVWRTRTRA